MRQSVPDCTMHLRNAAKAVGILNSTTLAMSSWDRTSPKKLREICRAQQLPSLRSSLMQARIKGGVCPPKCLNAESSRCLRRKEQFFQFMQTQTPDREHGLC